MAKFTNIEWCDHTVNLWWGCSKVHAGCDNCYAENLANRFGNDIWGEYKPRKEIKSAFPDLDKYQRQAEKKGVNYKIFMGSMMDIFEKPKPLIGNNLDTFYLRNKLFFNISSNFYPNLIFLFLTKRPSNIKKYIPKTWEGLPPENVWFGTSVSNQKTFYTLVPQLQKVRGNLFLSVEPQIDLIKIDESLKLINAHQNEIKWIIQGGESGPNRRPFKLDWATQLSKDCEALNIPYFFKQIDKKTPIPIHYWKRQFPNF